MNNPVNSIKYTEFISHLFQSQLRNNNNNKMTYYILLLLLLLNWDRKGQNKLHYTYFLMFKRAGFISNVQSSHAIGHTDIQTSCRCFNGKHQKPITEMYTVVLGHQTYMNRQFIICKMRCLRRAAILTFFCSTELVKGNRRATELVKLEIPCRCLWLRVSECSLSCAMHLFQHELRKGWCAWGLPNIPPFV